MPKCRDWVRGHCKRGSRCRFRHFKVERPEDLDDDDDDDDAGDGGGGGGNAGSE